MENPKIHKKGKKTTNIKGIYNQNKYIQKIEIKGRDGIQMRLILLMKALKCKTLGTCMAWQVRQIADDDSEVQLYSIAINDTLLHALLSHKLILLPSHLSAC